MKKNSLFIQVANRFIHSPSSIKKYRTSDNYFTRTRKITFGALVLFLMNMPKRTIALELHDFYEQAKDFFRNPLQKVSPSALTQSRGKLSPEIFVGIRDAISEEYYTENEERAELWNGFRPPLPRVCNAWLAKKSLAMQQGFFNYSRQRSFLTCLQNAGAMRYKRARAFL